MELRKSSKKQAKIKLALQGCAGSGKTYSALLLAYGLMTGARLQSLTAGMEVLTFMQIWGSIMYFRFKTSLRQKPMLRQ